MVDLRLRQRSARDASLSAYEAISGAECPPADGRPRAQYNKKRPGKPHLQTRRRTVSHLIVLGLAAMAVALPVRAQAEDPPPIRIGYLTDVSGPSSSNDGTAGVDAARMAIEDFGGTVLGRQIELLIGDHQGKVDVGTGIVRRWLDVDGVDAVMDMNNSAIALAASNLVLAKNKILLATAAASDSLTGKDCSPNLVQWLPDTYSNSRAVASLLTKNGLDTWFFISVDYALGQALVNSASQAIAAKGGKVLGTVKHPLGTADFASLLLQAQASDAKVLALASPGADMANLVKQAREFGLKMKTAVFMLYIMEVHSLGLADTAGIQFVDTFYWDLDDKSRAWSKRFFARNGKMPTAPQVNAYEGLYHYLKAIKAAGTTDTETVMKTMKTLRVDDATGDSGYIREDGRVIRDMHLFEVKSPQESKYPWDYFKTIGTLPGDQAYRSLTDGKCAFVTQNN
jgi:branched-chain amino acid transport system substrate-binding protein